jgi:hypothetical protein
MLAGCVPIHQESIDGHFAGLRSAFPSRAGTTNALHVIMVHGMGIHQMKYSDPLSTELAAELRLQKSGEAVEQIAANGFVYGWLRELTFRGRDKLLKVYEITWSPATEETKRSTFNLDAGLGFERQLVNASLKESLVDLALSDAVLYAGKYRAQIQRPIRAGINRLLQQLGDHDQIAAVTWSLGSYILFDTLGQMRDEEPSEPMNTPARGSIGELASRTVHVFMLANQLPLLELSTRGVPVAPGPTQSNDTSAPVVSAPHSTGVLKRFIDLRASHPQALARATGAAPVGLQVVAFSDPNDLLSYKLQPIDLGPPTAALANVTLTIEPWSIAGVAANPYQAHTGWDGSRRAIDLLVRGHSR